jgi:hypothetical protein
MEPGRDDRPGHPAAEVFRDRADEVSPDHPQPVALVDGDRITA